MLDPRVYRAAFVPALFAIVIAAFSLKEPPPSSSSTLAPDAFIGPRAFAGPTGLLTLAGSFPHRRPGGSGDRALAALVGSNLSRSGFTVRVRRFSGRTVIGRRRLEDVIGTRIGLSGRRIVVLAHRDALASPATADLSATAGLLELARVFSGRTLRKTLVLVSTSGGSGGAAGASAYAARAGGGDVDGVLVLGDLAGQRVRRPLVVPWSNSVAIAPVDLRATVDSALAAETGYRARDPRLASQFAHLAFPLTEGEQGQLGAHGLPAVTVGVAVERAPGNGSVSESRLQETGRAVLRAVTALDARDAPVSPPRAELLYRHKLIPGWAVRLVVGGLILPVLLTAVDGFARARRRREPLARWLAWTAASALPFVAALAFALLLEQTGLLPVAPPAPVTPGAIPLDTAAIAALVSIALVVVLGSLALRPLALTLARVRGDPASPGAATAVLLVMSGLVTAIWAFNPFAAAVLVILLHVCLLLLAPEVHVRSSPAAVGLAISLIPIALVVVYYARTLGLSVGEVPWAALLLVVGGHVGMLGALAWCLLLGLIASMVAIVHARGRQLGPPETPRTRGPGSYAGPGSLGGTESALRR